MPSDDLTAERPHHLVPGWAKPALVERLAGGRGYTRLPPSQRRVRRRINLAIGVVLAPLIALGGLPLLAAGVAGFTAVQFLTLEFVERCTAAEREATRAEIRRQWDAALAEGAPDPVDG